MGTQFMAIAHVWDQGDVDYINVLDNRALTTRTLEGSHTPEWMRERVALLRLCDVNRDPRGERLGRKFTDHMLYVNLTYDEYKELTEIINQTGVKQ